MKADVYRWQFCLFLSSLLSLISDTSFFYWQGIPIWCWFLSITIDIVVCSSLNGWHSYLFSEKLKLFPTSGNFHLPFPLPEMLFRPYSSQLFPTLSFRSLMPKLKSHPWITHDYLMSNATGTNDKLSNLSNLGAVHWPQTETCGGDCGFSHSRDWNWGLPLFLFHFLDKFPVGCKCDCGQLFKSLATPRDGNFFSLLKYQILTALLWVMCSSPNQSLL